MRLQGSFVAGCCLLAVGAYSFALAGLYGYVEYEGPHSPLWPLIRGTVSLVLSAVCFYAAGRVARR